MADMFSMEDRTCAACEATVRSIEELIKLGKHRGDGHGRVEIYVRGVRHSREQHAHAGSNLI